MAAYGDIFKGDSVMETITREAGEWLDKEPRQDGKPRRWRPFEVREAREFISQSSQGYQIQHPVDDTHLDGDRLDTQLSGAL
jgi:hypothetical protein